MKPLTQNEAIQVMLGVVTAIMDDDKEGREAVYADLSNDDLKRVIRWLARWYIHSIFSIGAMFGVDPVQAWKESLISINQGMADGTIKEME